MILADTNIWIYYLDRRTDEHQRVLPEMDRAIREEMLLAPTIVQSEVLHHIAAQVGPRATEPSHALLATPHEPAGLDPGTVDRARGLLLAQRDRGIGSRDAIILEHARAADATVLTHDQRLLEVAIDLGLDAHDPARREPS